MAVACDASYPQGIALWSAKERCTLGSAQMLDAVSDAAWRRSRQWNYPQGIAPLKAMGIYFAALQTGLLAGEQTAQPLDVLLGDLWRHRLALWPRRWCCLRPLIRRGRC